MSRVLTPEIQARIQHGIESGRYPDAESGIVKALVALADEDQARFLRHASSSSSASTAGQARN